MAAQLHTLDSRKEWLEFRTSMIGGSDASAVMGMNPYKSNVELYLEKTGQYQPEDISDKPYVKYGIEAEKPLIELFKLDYPKYEVVTMPFNAWTNDEYPWAHASLDGWIRDDAGRIGVLEIKTTEILRSQQKESWKDRVPDNYYIQIIHYLMVTEFDFAILKAQLKFQFDGEVFLQTRHYKIEREEVEEDIELLIQAEKKFAECVRKKKRPDLILPEI